MQTVKPDYYDAFCCIADRCRHTCCVGWEIDVDAAALARYERQPGPLGDRLRQSIVWDECPHFRLTPEERCPFLNEQNLCELILQQGPDALCQICTDHPRFRNELTGRVEIGLGLCCEAAGALILGRAAPVQLLVSGPAAPLTEWERLVLSVREQAIAIVQDRALPLARRLDAMLEAWDVQLPAYSWAQWARVLLSLERLDSAWEVQLLALCRAGEPAALPPHLQTPLEQLAVYLLYRHLPAARSEADLAARLAFAALLTRLVARLCQLHPGGCTLPDVVELARLCSSEIEYSEDNTEALLDLLWEANTGEP